MANNYGGWNPGGYIGGYEQNGPYSSYFNSYGRPYPGANNNGNGYGPNFMPVQPMQPSMGQQQQLNTNVRWIYVNGIEGANSFALSGPNQVAYMMSQNANEFYIKASDNVGVVSPLRCFRFYEFDPAAEAAQQANNTQNNNNWVSRDEFNNFANNVSSQFAAMQQNMMAGGSPAQQPQPQSQQATKSNGKKQTKEAEEQ